VNGRAQRALALIAVAVAAVVLTSLLYLRREPQPVAVSELAVPRLVGSYAPSFFFLDPTHGWALVGDYGPEQRFWIFVTTDGAAHWSRQFTQTAEGGQTYLRFFDLQHGFAYAGSLYRTADGGATWQSVRTPEAPNPYFTFVSATKGWQLGRQLYTTDDGGDTWKAVDHSPPPGTTGDLAFRADGEGWLGTALAEPSVWLTRNGGMGWDAIPLPNSQVGFESYTTAIRLLPGDAVLAIVGSPNGAVEGWYSDDRGASWRQVDPLPQPEWLAEATFLDSTNWWASRFGFLYKTADAGRNWTRVSVQPLPEGWNIGPVHAIDAQHGWWSMTATTDSRDSALMMTSDGGTSWRAVAMPTPG
jgi:photosystem II stability/assembly factor-like uncharacterized protein